MDNANLMLNEVHNDEIAWQQFMVDKNTMNEDFKITKLVGDIVVDRQMTLLGHVLRREPHELMRQVTCDSNLRRPYQLYKRVGHPRSSWTNDHLERAHIQYGKNIGPVSHENADQVTAIKTAAINRTFSSES